MPHAGASCIVSVVANLTKTIFAKPEAGACTWGVVVQVGLAIAIRCINDKFLDHLARTHELYRG